MGLDVNKIMLPVMDFELSSHEDERFRKVKIWIAHTGENLNNTYFSLNALEEMSKSLPYVPIVGYIDKNSLDEVDFRDHRQEIVIKQDEVEFRYLGQPYGFIPENAQAQIELRGGKEWLTAVGYMWTKFEDGIQIMEKANGRKSQSMEIQNVEGVVTEEGVLDIHKAQFSALCILGEDVPPAMVGSTIEMFSADEGFKKEMSEMLKEFAQKGEGTLDKEKHFEQEEKENKPVNEEIEETEATEEVVNDEVEKVEQEEVEEDTEPEVVEEKEEDVEEIPENELVDENTEPTENFEDDGDDDSNEREKLEKRIEELLEEVARLEEELEELGEYKAQRENADKQELLDKYSARIGEKATKDIREKFAEYSLNDVEREIALAVLKGEEQSEQDVKPSVGVYNFKTKKDDDVPYSTLSEYFNK